MKFIKISNDKLLHVFYNTEISIYNIFTEFLNFDLSNHEEIYKIVKSKWAVKGDYSRDKVNTLITNELICNFLNNEVKNSNHPHFYFDSFNSELKYFITNKIKKLIDIQSFFIELVRNQLSYNFLLDSLIKTSDINLTFTFYNNRMCEVYELNDILSYCLLAVTKLEDSRKAIKACQNCGNFFVPLRRSDEIYCDKSHGNGRTCKDMGFENKIQDDEVYKEYRRIYQNKNAKKQRQKNIDPTAKEKFDVWAYNAKLRLDAYYEGTISKDNLLSWLEKN